MKAEQSELSNVMHHTAADGSLTIGRFTKLLNTSSKWYKNQKQDINNDYLPVVVLMMTYCRTKFSLSAYDAGIA